MNIRSWLVKFILKLGNAKWVVFREHSIGFVIFDVPVEYYKWHDTFIVGDKNIKDYRLANKRELSKGIRFDSHDESPLDKKKNCPVCGCGIPGKDKPCDACWDKHLNG